MTTAMPRCRPFCPKKPFTGPGGTTWLVSGSNGENLILAYGPTQGAAWMEAVRQARELSMIELAPGGSLGD